MDALNDERNRDGQEETNETHCKDTSLFAVTIAP
jgi:hypothetical protein